MEELINISILVLILVSCNESSNEKNKYTSFKPLDSNVEQEKKEKKQIEKEALASEVMDDKDLIKGDCEITLTLAPNVETCSKSFLISSDAGIKEDSVTSQYLYNAFFDSCGVGYYEMLKSDTNRDKINQAILSTYKFGVCSKIKIVSKNYFNDRKVELLFPMKKHSDSFILLANELLLINEIDGILVSWNNFRIEDFSNFEKFWLDVLEEKNFFILCDLYILLSLNGYDERKKVILNEIQVQEKDFPEYVDQLIDLEDQKNSLKYYDYFESMYMN